MSHSWRSQRAMLGAVLGTGAAVLGAVAACGLSDAADRPDDGGADVDAARDGGSGRDAPSEGGRCDDVYAPFDEPELVVLPGPPGERQSAFLSNDERRIVYTLIIDDGDGGARYALFEATRPFAAGSFDTFRELSELYSGANEHSPTLSSDFNTMYFASVRGGVGHISKSTRSDANGSFTVPTTVPALDIEEHRRDPFLAQHAAELWFTAGSFSTGSFGIYLSNREADGEWAAPVTVVELSSDSQSPLPAYDTSPVLSADGLTIYWSSFGRLSLQDISIATRGATRHAFERLQVVTEVSSSFADYPVWLSVDQCRLYFISERERVAGPLKLYMVSRRP